MIQATGRKCRPDRAVHTKIMAKREVKTNKRIEAFMVSPSSAVLPAYSVGCSFQFLRLIVPFLACIVCIWRVHKRE